MSNALKLQEPGTVVTPVSIDINRYRLAVLQTKLDFLSELNQTLTNLLQHAESGRLEWIVILLILSWK